MSRTPLAFLSYVNLDDQHDQGRLTQFRERLSGEVRMHTGEPFDIFQDRKDIAWGQQWQERLDTSLAAVTFLLPIITPAFFKSNACRAELERFLKREKELGRSDLILPVYYLNCPVLSDKAKLEQDQLAQIVAARQYADWRHLRFKPFDSEQVCETLAKMAQQIVAALERSHIESSRAAAARPASKQPEKESKGAAASQSNTFQSGGGTQSVAQGKGAIGTQNNYYGPSHNKPPRSVMRSIIMACALIGIALFAANYHLAQSDNQTKVEKPPVNYTDSSDEDKHDRDILSRVFRKSYAVVIGISSYQNHSAWETLDNAENDAKAMDEFLIGQGFTVKRFVDNEATKSNIVSYIEDTLAPELTQDDRFVFYFSGHGNTKRVGGSDRGYLIPYDGDTDKSSTWISMEHLQEIAAKLGNARHQLFILDSAFGGIFEIKGSMSSTKAPSVTVPCARQYLTAGGANEEIPARSNLYGYRTYSHYTAYLLKGLREGVADISRDGFITASELNAYLRIAAATKFNKPRGGTFPGHEQGDFVFRSPKP